MSTPANVYYRDVIHPLATGNYLISQFTSTVLNTKDEYRIVIEEGTDHCDVSSKTSLGFTLDLSVGSPAQPVTVYIEFLRAVDPLPFV